MDADKLRRNICFHAARLLHSRQESNFTTARWRAARSITRSYLPGECLPTDMEIRLALQDLISSSPPVSPLSFDAEHSDASLKVAYHSLLEPLDRVRLNRREHPEGDLLYHSLQVFHLARDGRPWDEEFVTAALLHDVGHGIDPYDPLPATVRAIEDLVSERTLWLVENLPLQHRKADGTIGARARRRLDAHEDGDALRFLAECDLDGRVPGRPVDSLTDALQSLFEISGNDD
ncbi:MAG: hypothetical protein NXI04_17720 [Planctomycetaceae bacterium]|nr:hypothetical protein [Planctomycetaceae bacterium]